MRGAGVRGRVSGEAMMQLRGCLAGAGGARLYSGGSQGGAGMIQGWVDWAGHHHQI